MAWKDIIYIFGLLIVASALFCMYTRSRYRNVIEVNPEILKLVQNANAGVKYSCPKILWMYWEQGIENIHEYHQGAYNKMCFDGWSRLNPDWDIRILDKTSALEYVPELRNFNHLTLPMRSDLLRIKLLEKYGGVWADASTLPMKPLTGWVENCDEGTGIFFYRYFPGVLSRLYNPFACYISSWFMVAKRPHHYVIQRLANKFEQRVVKKNLHTIFRYFYFHETLTHLINNDELVKTHVNGLTTSQVLSHRNGPGDTRPPLDKKHVKDHPLCYKRAPVIDPVEYYNYINTF